MAHPLVEEYELTADELLDAINRRFRAKVTLEGAVAEVHLGKHIRTVLEKGLILDYKEHDIDSYPDYTIWIPGGSENGYRIECKNVRDSQEAYRKGGAIVSYKVETQKTRTSMANGSSRFYGIDQFEILAVCLGKKTHNWRQFLFIRAQHLGRHHNYPHKLAVMHRVPLPSEPIGLPWHDSLESIITEIASV